MSNQNNMSKIMLKYYKGLVDENELKIYKLKLREIDIELIEYDKSYVPMACLEDFTNQVNLMISSPIVQSITMGLMTNASYNLLKGAIIWMWNSLIGKEIAKVRANGNCDVKEATFGFSASIDNETKIDFRLSGDISDEDKNKCIEKAFELLKDSQKKISPYGSDFAKYDYEKEEWILIDINEERRKVVQKQKLNY